MIRVLLAILLAMGSSACASQPSVRSDGYYNDRYAYRVRNLSPGYLASGDWILENFQTDEQGRPTSPKTGPTYRGTFRADVDGDGTLEKADQIALYDLRFVHKRTNAHLWLSAIPVSQTQAQTDLAVLGKAFVDAVAGGGLRIERIGDVVVGHEQRYATRILDQKPIQIDGMPAHRITFEMASVDQLKLDPQSRWQRVTVAIVRPGFYWSPATGKHAKQLFPVLLMAGYESAPEHFDAGVPELDSLLQRIAFVPTPFAADASGLIACAGGREPIRLVLTKAALVSPDLEPDQIECARKLLEDRHWPLDFHKSFIVRSIDESR